jgi:hypothetical protein
MHHSCLIAKVAADGFGYSLVFWLSASSALQFLASDSTATAGALLSRACVDRCDKNEEAAGRGLVNLQLALALST